MELSTHNRRAPQFDLAGPRYEQVFCQLRNALSEGQWGVGTMLPSEVTLARDFGVSIGTIRKALGKLETLGLISRHPGRGTLVIDRTFLSSRLLDRYKYEDDLPERQRSEILSCEISEARPIDCEELRIQAKAPVVLFEHLEQRQGGLSVLETARVSAHAFGLNKKDEPDLKSHVAAYLLRRHQLIGKCKEHIGIVRADERRSAVLRVPCDRPLLHSMRTSFGLDGAPAEFSERYISLGDCRFTVGE